MTVQLLTGDCRQMLRTLPDASAQCCVTSPPYFGLRSYLRVDHPLKHLELGLEGTPEEFVSVMVDVFREVRRVLRDDGTLWLNIGDSYATTPRGNREGDLSTSSLTNPARQDKLWGKYKYRSAAREPRVRAFGDIKNKDMIGIPWMLAFALRADGWFLRQEIIWSKPNPMPESVTDRCTKAHESLFLLSKSPRYFFDQQAIAEGACARPAGNTSHRGADAYAAGDRQHRKASGLVAFAERQRRSRGVPPRHAQYPESCDQSGLDQVERGGKRNRRSVWTVATVPYREAHFATFPPALIEPCILAGCPVGGTVLDPFGGSGTTGMVAQRLGRQATLIDLNEDYEPMQQRRIRSGNVGLPLGDAA